MDESFIGEIRLFAGNFAPMGWQFCNGQTVLIEGNEALYSIIGISYGGNGRTDFQLPKLAPLRENDGGETPIQYVICCEGYYPDRP